ncbi:MAG: MCE family protein [Alphaproteobacteria bacterium]|nr:MCE family protein [Alphaproteobacteria bacterium]
MRKKASKKLIGIFWACSLALVAVLAGFWLSDQASDEDGRTVVMYFEESISGLNVGSDVVLKGVKVGEVKRINIQINSDTLTFSIPVYAVMKKKVISTINKNNGSDLNELIEKGLRARLAVQSYVTGQLMIDLEMLPDTPIKYHDVKDIKEIPTALSAFGELSRNLQSLPIAEGVKNFTEFFASLNKVMPDIETVAQNMSQWTNKTKKAGMQMPENANNMMINVEAAAKSLKNLTDYLERHPEALLRGKKQ